MRIRVIKSKKKDSNPSAPKKEMLFARQYHLNKILLHGYQPTETTISKDPPNTGSSVQPANIYIKNK